MRKPTQLATLYIDFDAFFANVERQLDPALVNRPVGVAPLDSDYSSLIACCYAAKAMGLKRGMRVNEAREICPDLAVRVARHDVYVKMHNNIVAEVGTLLPVKKVWSIDEVECDLATATDEDAIALARAVRARLKSHIGPYITPSIGLSANQLLAKIAAEMEKPNGFTIIHPRDIPKRLKDVALDDIPGVGQGMQERLAKAGVTSTLALYNLAPKHVRAIWRSVEGERLWSQLHGYPIERPPVTRRMFGHSRVLTRGWHTQDKAEECLKLLTAKAARRLRYDGFLASKMTVGIKRDDGRKISREVSFAPARDDFEILSQMRGLFHGICRAVRIDKFLSVSVFLHGLSRPGDVPDDLFSTAPARTEAANHDRISDIMDSLNSRFGADVLHLGTREQPPGGYAGAKIAFGRVPSFEDFAKPQSGASPAKRKKRSKLLPPQP